MLNPESYDGARVLEASGRPILVIGRSYWVVPIQDDDDVKTEAGMKLAEETTEKSEAEAGTTGTAVQEGIAKFADETTE